MMKYLILWGEAPEYQYEEYLNTKEEALHFINCEFAGVKWNVSPEGHWIKLYEEVELK